MEDPPSAIRFLIFRPPLEEAQGLGNVMNGLLAAHILGQEFNRTVCVSPEWSDLAVALESLTPECRHSTLGPRTPQNTIWLINYAKKPNNECELKHRLEGKEAVIYFVANTYPRWPQTTPLTIDLTEYYRPTTELQAILPWTTPPKIVVHLREPDNDQDHRAGLDSPTRTALGTALPSDTFLVTNRVDYYQWFHERYGWQHPPWTGVRHSAIPNIQWTSRVTVTHAEESRQLWADWWTIYNANLLYHTHSDFSRSAARWRQSEDSFTIAGIQEDSGALIINRDIWGDNGVLPLSERDGITLQNCNAGNGLGHDFDLDDEMHDDIAGARKIGNVR
jgi:hypothetical protein